VVVGIIGDFDASRESHRATNDAIAHSARYLSVKADVSWIPTPSILAKKGPQGLEKFDGLWASPGSPYQSMEGAIRGIQLARQADRPFIGT
jgi:CTP synthase (UTP-ammonia lyase)